MKRISVIGAASKWVAPMLVLVIVLQTWTAFAGTTILVQATDTYGPASCYPFGKPNGTYQGFIYRDLPAFDLAAGDIIAWDLGNPNDETIVMDIAVAAAVSNGSWEPDANGFTTVVSAGIPADANGDAIAGNYELAFAVDSSFSFPGGGLIVRFRPTGSYLGDGSCGQVLMYGDADDPSGQFVGRFYLEEDGGYPWAGTGATYIGNMQITARDANGLPVAGDDGGTGFVTDQDTPFTTDSVLANDGDPEHDPLMVSSLNDSSLAGLLSYNGDGTFDYDPDGQFDHLGVGDSATDQFSYTLRDINGGADTATVTITINGINDDPVAVDDGGAGFTTDEDTPFVTGNVLSNDGDPEGDTLSVDDADTTALKGELTDQGDGTFGYDPNGQFEHLGVGDSTTDHFTYTVGDGHGGTGTATVTIGISGVNDPPVAVDDDYVTASGTPLSVPGGDGVLDNDIDPEQDALTGVLDTDPVGDLSFSTDGSFSYTPTLGFLGADTFTYHAGDGLAASNVAIATVHVLDPGDVDLEMSKTVDDETPDEGSTVVYALTVTNNGPADATGIEVGDSLPAGVTYVSDDGGGVYDGATWNVGDLLAKASATLRITVAVDAGTANTTITNTATLGAVDQTDPVSGNDEAQAVLEAREPLETHGPVVTSVIPAKGAIEVSLGQDVVVNFGESIDAATFKYTVAPDPGGWMKAWNGAMTQVTLSHDDFEHWTHYTVTVTGAEDLTGNAMEHPYAWSFTTAPHWQFLPVVVRGLSHQPNRR